LIHDRTYDGNGACPSCYVDIRADLAAANASLEEYKRLLDEEVVASLALTAELNDIAAAAGIFRHPDEKDQLANFVEGLVARLALLKKVAERITGDHERSKRMADQMGVSPYRPCECKTCAALRGLKEGCAPSAPPASQVANKISGE
jgi:hypothetical protein